MSKEADRLKITVLKRLDTREVFQDPPVKAKYNGPCSIFKEGQVFYVDHSMPREFCPLCLGRDLFVNCNAQVKWQLQ